MALAVGKPTRVSRVFVSSPTPLLFVYLCAATGCLKLPGEKVVISRSSVQELGNGGFTCAATFSDLMSAEHP